MKFIIFSLLIIAYSSSTQISDYPINTFIGTGGYGYGIGSNPIGA